MRGVVESVAPDGDCAFAAVDVKADKDETRMAVSQFERHHPGLLLSLPAPNLPEGSLTSTIEEHARNLRPTLTFKEYCDLMERPYSEGGPFGEMLELAVYAHIHEVSVEIYVRLPDAEHGWFANIGTLGATTTGEEVRRLVWNGSHFDRLHLLV